MTHDRPIAKPASANGRRNHRSGLVVLIAWMVFGAFVAGYYTGKQLARGDNRQEPHSPPASGG